MTTDELIEQAKGLRQRIEPYGNDNIEPSRAPGAKAQVCQFLATYAGPKISFVAQANEAGGYASYQVGQLTAVLDAYCKALRTADLISKQDVKDVTAWAGIRNDAAHGDWAKVEDHNRVRLMLEGINLFMRQKTP
ncbi:MAG: hypothetical protein PHN85_08490 [Kiritimatiellae bacterium]|nr:hypothetical protein [Kiritimatiellia bacterium]